VANNISGMLTPLATATARHGSPVSVGAYSFPTGMVITGSTGIVLDTCSGQVSLFSTRTRHVDAPITVGDFPVAVAITS
jgi:hypothetical protein